MSKFFDWLNDFAGHRRAANFAGFAACAFMMGFALFVQHVLKHEPCSLCILQRIATISLGLVFLAAALHDPKSWGRRTYAALAIGVALAGIGVSIRNLWVIAQPKGSIAACGAGFYDLFDMLPFQDAMAAVLKGGGDCQDVTFTLLGLPFPAGVLICLASLAAWAIYVNARQEARLS